MSPKGFSFPRQLPSISFEPIRYRPNGLGFWSGHIPFACDLVATLRPRTLVELGTQMGESYFAFCQSIHENGVACQSFAVDTWRGDQHTRPYDDVVFQDVDGHNRQHYSRFSTLLRMTFDEAIEQFADATIDLLHIDGAHTYDAIRHDFETWWPKMKEGGVVLMHDSAERRWDFGVWRLLEELRQQGLPAQEFFHSHGLAVIVKPPITPDANVATALVTAQPDQLEQILRYYEVCARSLLGRHLQLRKSKPADWEIITQLFWRTEQPDFNEEHSVQLAHLATETPTEAVLHVPPSQLPYAGFRLAVTILPALLRLWKVTVVDRSSSTVWERSDAHGILLPGEPSKSYMDFRWPSSLQQGGQVKLLLSGVDPLTLVV